MNPKKTVALIALLLMVAMFNAPHSASADIPGHLKIVSLQAFKYQGYQPLDVTAQVTDDFDNPISDANVVVRLSENSTQLFNLKSQGKGLYTGCDIAYLDGASDVTVTAEASKAGMTGATLSANAEPGNLCGDGMPQMLVGQINAAKPDGKDQPLDIAVKLRDETGRAVVGANVAAEAIDSTGNHISVLLMDRGNGLYIACNAGLFSTTGAGAISVHVRAYGAGFRGTEGEALNTVGSLCSGTAPRPTPATHRLSPPVRSR